MREFKKPSCLQLKRNNGDIRKLFSIADLSDDKCLCLSEKTKQKKTSVWCLSINYLHSYKGLLRGLCPSPAVNK